MSKCCSFNVPVINVVACLGVVTEKHFYVYDTSPMWLPELCVSECLGVCVRNVVMRHKKRGVCNYTGGL